MGTSRQSRDSEIVMDRIWREMKNLVCCVWHGHLKEEAKEIADNIKRNLDEMIDLMENE